MKKRLLVWSFVAILAYPVYVGALLVVDALRGDRLLSHFVRHDRRLLWDTFWADFADALPLVLGLSLFVALGTMGVRRWGGGTALRAWAGGLVLVLGTAVVSTVLRNPAVLHLTRDEPATSSHFFVIGGGPTPHASEAQIEFNVSWVLGTLEALVPDAVTRVFYANGDGPEPGTVEHLAEATGDALRYEPLARVFGEEEPNRLRFRPHGIERAEGSTHADVVIPRLGSALEALEPGDQAFIVYNGHGTWREDRAENSLRLWDESRLSVRDMEALLSRVDASVPVRLFLTQCYSGAFERVVHPGAEDVLELAEGTRCGFFAESEDRESEGCSASIVVGDYRDYTTYFFAALSGETRVGESVASRRDWDGDGVVTPFDAHLFTLVHGRNGDLPRATSEVYLERWQPWAARWAGTGRLPDNLYAEAARQMARDNGLPEDNPELGPALRARYEAVVREIESASGEARRLQGAAQGLQASLQEGLVRRWPMLLHPYTAGYRESVESDLEAMSEHLRSRPDYDELERVQDRSQALELRLVELDRDLSQLEKIQRTRMLARTLDQLLRYGSPEHQEGYAKLRRCEALPLGDD